MASRLLRSAGSAVLLSTVFASEKPQEDPALQLDALAGDDECSNSEECALQALQVRGAPAVDEEGKPNTVFQDVEMHGDVLTIELPEGWTMENDYPETWDWQPDEATGSAKYKDPLDVVDDISLHPASYHKKPQAREVGPGGCRQTPGARECYFYRKCQGPHYCVINGYMIVPGFPVAGMENVDGSNAGVFDYLMYAGQKRCESTSCVLIINPIHYRSQEQMHIHYRRLTRGGHEVQKQLEHTLCHAQDGWHYFPKCAEGKARLYDYMPAVFSEVAAAFGGGNLAHVGISVWNTKACGGYKTIVLATTHCSIEHDITRR